MNEDEQIPTRRSLLSRLRDWNDQASWKQFFDTYWKLIYNSALKSGLSDAEAQEVVQETVIAVCKSIGDFHYREENGSFKSWLLQRTTWRIQDQYRRRQRPLVPAHRRVEAGPEIMEQVPDTTLELESIWNQEWQRNLMDAALSRVKGQVDHRQYQMFDLHALKRWPVKKITSLLGVSATQVYLAKHRISALLRREVAALEKKPI